MKSRSWMKGRRMEKIIINNIQIKNSTKKIKRVKNFFNLKKKRLLSKMNLRLKLVKAIRKNYFRIMNLMIMLMIFKIQREKINNN